jgi:HAD superfamily hydrolase (TIGR01509 family)
VTLRALIFDFDGIILETEGPEYHSWKQIYADYGVDLPLALWVKVIGSDYDSVGWDPYTHLAEESGQSIDKEAIHAKRRPLHRELVAKQPIMPGVEALIQQAAQAGLPLAVASSSSRAWVEGHLDRIGLRRYFAAIRTRDDVERIKPGPDLFLAAAEALGVPPASTVVIEDSAHGVQAAKAAGSRVIAVPHELTKNTNFTAADRVVESLEGLTLADLQALVPTQQ